MIRVSIGETSRMALRSLRANKLRSLLTTLGIVIGITTVISITSVITGLNQSFERELSTIGSNVLYIQRHKWAGSDWQISRSWRDIGEKEYEYVKNAVPGMRFSNLATAMLQDMATVKYRRNKLSDVLVVGTEVDYQEMRGAYPIVGRFFNHVEDQRRRDVAVIGWEVSQKLFGQLYPIGKRIFIKGDAYTVVGVLESRGDFFDLNLDRNILIPLGSFTKHYGSKRSMTIIVRPIDDAHVDQAYEEATGVMRRARGLEFGQKDDFAVNKIDVLQELYGKLTGGLYGAMFGVATISLLVGGIGIMNIMLVSVTERTKEIGIRKAVGAKHSAIMAQFLFEAIALSVVGGIIGMALGFGVAALVNAVSPVPAQVRWWSVALGIGFSAAVGIFFGYFPAKSAAAKDPIECLRYE
ncbi:MAG: ABC transporter permease [Deltaproteobacteria bacterium]|nr:ABC transporter permease [Deltaproteobacteria bacterium]MCB9479967.1 ABC transporter permease [Deltaproteobacteria bacterium]MCB9489233.1 ABC transporter permease [Deltaproteobacteria bacterium]